MSIINKTMRKMMKLRLQPIRVFCFHQVSNVYDVNTMWENDWMQIDEFKKKIILMHNNGVKYISLTDAYLHISKDKLRKQRYAVITFDDGWVSLQNIIPWLVAQRIPITLFLNPAYLLNEDKREKGISLNQAELDKLLQGGKGLIQIASHGWNHALCTDLDKLHFEENVDKSVAFLSKYDEYIPYFAYPCGRHTATQDVILQAKGITPVYCDGMKNYNDKSVIHREC